MSNRIVTYEPNNSVKRGYWSLIQQIFVEIKENRWLTYQLFKRDFFATYKQSMIGVVWVFILPLINVATFVMLSQSGIFQVGEITVPYPLYAILGMSFWQIFSSGVVTAGSSLSNAGEMVTRINFSKKSLVFATMGRPLVSFLIQMLLVGILCIIYRIMPAPGAILIPLAILPVMFFTLGLGLLLAILNAIIRDTGNLLYIGLTLLMYLTPVLYAKPKWGILVAITKYNPMYYFVSAGRDLFLRGTIVEWQGFLASALLGVVLFFLALIVFHLTETRIAERV